MYLEREGYRVHSVADGEAALEAVASLNPDALVLDIMLPKIDGLEVCRRLRAENNPIPIIMLTARGDDYDKILGLELGADDYLTKPFNPRELVARVKALLRRRDRFATQASQTPVRLGNTLVDPGAREVRVDDEPVPLRAQEFDLLWVLVQHRGMVLSREQLLRLAWGYDYIGQTRTVDVHIAHLRKKLANSDIRIETVTGVGYKLVVD
ncbi:MAG: response regulator transcription factor [Chloroflexi bacterium]|nr:response regulator transcription factor [Chloroflexota bacterium]